MISEAVGTIQKAYQLYNHYQNISKTIIIYFDVLVIMFTFYRMKELSYSLDFLKIHFQNDEAFRYKLSTSLSKNVSICSILFYILNYLIIGLLIGYYS